MMRLADNIPGQPHRWADAIGAWARGELVQWRYASPEATDADWRDCDYPSRGMPNWDYDGIEYRVAQATDLLAAIEARMEEYGAVANDSANSETVRRRARTKYGEARAIHAIVRASHGVGGTLDDQGEKQ